MARHRRTRRQLKKQRKIIAISLIGFLFIMVGGYAAFQTNLNITAKGNIVDRSRVIQSWTITSNEDFHTDYYRENIVTVTFLDTNQVASDATESWDVSVDKDRGVMAWVVPNSEDNTKYDLYIGANKGVIANEDSSYLFRHFTGVVSIVFDENFDTSNMVNMQSMFGYTINLTSLDLSSFDTRNVTNMANLFCMWTEEDGIATETSLSTIIFGDKWDTSNVTNMKDVFTGTSVTNLDLSNWDTANVTYMYHMFNRCDKLVELNLCGWDTSKVYNMEAMFANTPILKNIHVGPNWTTSQADTTEMFIGSGVSSVTTGQC